MTEVFFCFFAKLGPKIPFEILQNQLICLGILKIGVEQLAFLQKPIEKHNNIFAKLQSALILLVISHSRINNIKANE